MRINLKSNVIGLAAFLIAPAQVLADAGQGSAHGHMMGDGWFMGPMMMLAALVVIIVTVVLLTRHFGVSSGANNSSLSARGILEERFARGEIDKDEFEDRKRTLAG